LRRNYKQLSTTPDLLVFDTRKEKGSKPSTAAMRIGLADAPIKYGDIVYYG
jgi:hypothetical protein